MMNKIYKHLLVASLLMMGGTAMAQTLNSAYFRRLQVPARYEPGF